MDHKFKVGDIVRTGDGPTALMRIEKLHNNGRDCYYGEHCMGGACMTYDYNAIAATPKDLKIFKENASWRREEESLLDKATSDAAEEAQTAMSKWPPMNSAHEGFAVLNEEVDELWEHVKTNQKKRDLAAMRKEAIQIAAMALRFAVDVCSEERGRK